MLRADMDMRPVDAPLQHRPESLDAVHRLPFGADIFADLMPHFRVLIAALAKHVVGGQRVGVDMRSGEDVFLNKCGAGSRA